MTQPSITFDQVLAHAKQRFGGTDAEFDYSVAANASIELRSDARPDSSHVPAGDAMREIDNAIYWLASTSDNTPAEREAAQRQLRAALATEIEAYAAACRARKYVGWSKYSSGPIRYAEDAS